MVDGYFQAASERGLGDISSQTILADCASGRFKLLVVADEGLNILAAAAARFVEHANKDTACELIACGGKSLKLWRGIVPEFEAWAKHYGAKHVRLSGRPGWQKVFTGYRRAPFITLIKEL